MLLGIIAVMVAVLNILFRQSYNILFFAFGQPHIWIAVVAVLGFLWIGLGTISAIGLNGAVWSATIALLLNIPPQRSINREDMAHLADQLSYVKGSTTKYRIGLGAFAVGAVAGWIFFFGQYVPGRI